MSGYRLQVTDFIYRKFFLTPDPCPLIPKRQFSVFSFQFSVLIFLLAISFSSCRKPEENFKATPYDLKIPRHFPTQLNIPSDNPMTVEGVALGQKLFHDGHLCGYTGSDEAQMMSCATCHNPQHGFDIGTDNPRFPGGQPIGLSGQPTHHVPLPLVNLVFNSNGYLWNGATKSLEDIVLATFTDPTEMNGSYAGVVAAIKSNNTYPLMFEKAFGTPEVTIDRIAKAIAQYVRTLISADSKFDKYLQGEVQLTPQELNGYVLFTTEEGADCFHCHGGGGTPLFTTNLCYNNALDNVFSDPHDRFSVTGDPMDHGAYKAPTLRNIAVSAPYMHDGRFKTLDEVLEFYNTGQKNSPYVSPLMHHVNDGGVMLTPSQIADLKAFLETLTDEELTVDN